MNGPPGWRRFNWTVKGRFMPAMEAAQRLAGQLVRGPSTEQWQTSRATDSWKPRPLKSTSPFHSKRAAAEVSRAQVQLGSSWLKTRSNGEGKCNEAEFEPMLRTTLSPLSQVMLLGGLGKWKDIIRQAGSDKRRHSARTIRRIHPRSSPQTRQDNAKRRSLCIARKERSCAARSIVVQTKTVHHGCK